MAVTKLLHMKEAKGSNKAAHLKNAIQYILNEKKTEHGLLVGGIGTTPKEVYDTLLRTKKDWNKMEGRQGYHFVISFPPGQSDKETVCQIMDEFCSQLLGISYEYVWAVHTDTDHLHGHVIFNSVSRDTGMKYHYSNGDWEKIIQPITDKVCQKYGLPVLEVTASGHNKNHAEWEREKKGCLTGRDLIRHDIDEAISASGSQEDVINYMREMGYQIRSGTSKKHGAYYSFTPPGSKRAFRSYTLGKGYGHEDIKMRIKMRGAEPKAAVIRKPYPVSAWRYRRYYITNTQLVRIQRHYRASVLTRYQQGGQRRDRGAISRIVAECDWMARCGIGKEIGTHEYRKLLEYQEEELKRELHQLQSEMKSASPLLDEYRHLLEAAKNAKEHEFEELDDRLQAMEDRHPVESMEQEYSAQQEKFRVIRGKLKILYQEKRMAERVINKMHQKQR